jgi:formylglycine-generating enzyme required for sulfatase activity
MMPRTGGHGGIFFRLLWKNPPNPSLQRGNIFSGKTLTCFSWLWDRQSQTEIIYNRIEVLSGMKTVFIHLLLLIIPLTMSVQAGDMALIPSGAFLMGSLDGEADEHPVHQVHVDAFYIDRHPVTNADYARFLNMFGNRVEGGKRWLDIDGPLSSWLCKIRKKEGRYVPKPGYENHPVVKVSWYGATAYARWVGKRLPTEMEWEKAARGVDGRVYPWGDEWDRNKCNSASWWIGEDVITGDDRAKKFEPRWEEEWRGKQVMTTPIAQFKDGASPYGCFDMAGNVWEWTADWYSEGKTCVVRGGSWSNPQDYVRGAVRFYLNPDNRYSNLGFRCAE